MLNHFWFSFLFGRWLTRISNCRWGQVRSEVRRSLRSGILWILRLRPKQSCVLCSNPQFGFHGNLYLPFGYEGRVKLFDTNSFSSLRSVEGSECAKRGRANLFTFSREGNNKGGKNAKKLFSNNLSAFDEVFRVKTDLIKALWGF